MVENASLFGSLNSTLDSEWIQVSVSSILVLVGIDHGSGFPSNRSTGWLSVAFRNVDYFQPVCRNPKGKISVAAVNIGVFLNFHLSTYLDRLRRGFPRKFVELEFTAWLWRRLRRHLRWEITAAGGVSHGRFEFAWRHHMIFCWTSISRTIAYRLAPRRASNQRDNRVLCKMVAIYIFLPALCQISHKFYFTHALGLFPTPLQFYLKRLVNRGYTFFWTSNLSWLPTCTLPSRALQRTPQTHSRSPHVPSSWCHRTARLSTENTRLYYYLYLSAAFLNL